MCAPFAFHHGVGIETFARVPRAACPLGDDELLSGLASGMIPIRTGGGLIWVVAPWQLSARFLVDRLRRHPDMRARIRVATMESLARIHSPRSRDRGRAQGRLRTARDQARTCPPAPRRSRTPLAWFAAGIGLLVALSAVQSNLTLAVDIAFALIFLGWSGLRVARHRCCRRQQTAGAAAAQRRYPAALFDHRRDLQRGGIGAGCWPRR